MEAKAELRSAADGSAVPLVSARLTARLTGLCAALTLEETFVNAAAAPVEAAFEFALGGAVVCGFAAAVAQRRTLEGVVRERSQAFARYDDAVSAGQTAAIAEQTQDKEGTVTVAIGNLPPGEECKIVVEFLLVARCENGCTRLSVPLTSGLRLSSAAAASPATASIEVEATPAGRRIVSIGSPSHGRSGVCNVAEDGRSASFRFSAPDNFGDAPFLLEVYEDEPHKPALVVERDPTERDTALLVSFAPHLDAEQLIPGSSLEVVFIVDCSGSMSGSRIDRARLALLLCLRGLPNGCLFNVLRFGSEFDTIFPESLVYSDSSFKKAEQLLANLKGNYGGTNILSPLRSVFERPIPQGRRRQVFVLTDGDVSNDQEVIRLCSSQRGKARIFSFGIGADAGRKLVTQIAEVTDGKSVFITETAFIPQEVMAQLSCAVQPSFTDVRVECSIPGTKFSPGSLPPIFNDETYTIFGLAPAEAASEGSRPVEVTLAATDPIGTTRRFELRSSSLSKGLTVHKLAAASAIKDMLLEGDAHKEEVTRMALRFRLLSKFTSFVVVDTEARHATQRSMVKTRASGADTASFDPSFTSFAPSQQLDTGSFPDFSGFTYVAQDAQLDAIAEQVRQIQEIAASIGQELQEQGELIQDLEPSKPRSVAGRLMDWMHSFTRKERAPAAPAPPSAAADVSQRYDLLRVVGKGSFGKTMQARQKDSGEVVAVTVRSSRYPDGDARAMTFSGTPEYFTPEMILGSYCFGELCHGEKSLTLRGSPFVRRLLEFNHDASKDKDYCVYENTATELFFILQQNRRLPIEVARIVAAELVSATEYLQGEGVSIGMLAPENMLLNESGVLKLDQETFRDAKTGSDKADVFVIGSLIFELLTGLPPFYDNDIQAMYRRLTQEDVKFPSEFDPAARDLLASMLAKDPAARPSITVIKSHAFFSTIDWVRLQNLEIAAPSILVPKQQDANDTSFIDAAFTSESVPSPPLAAAVPKLAPKPKGPTRRQRFEVILLLCTAEGSWPLSNELAEFFGGIAGLKQAKPVASSDSCWATSVTISALQLFFSDFEAEWRMLANKAASFLASNIKDKAVLAQVQDAALAFVRSNFSVQH